MAEKLTLASAQNPREVMRVINLLAERIEELTDLLVARDLLRERDLSHRPDEPSG